MIFNMNCGGGKKVPTLNSSYPQDLAVVAGDTATFMVLFDEEGKPADYVYTWYVNGSVVPGAKSQNYVRDTTSDTGTYTVSCVVANAAGTVTSRAACVTVQHLLTVNSNADATIIATSGGKTVSGTCDSSGVATLLLEDGSWTIKATSGTVAASLTIAVDAHKSISLIANKVPAFTYTGSYEIVDDIDSAISGSIDDWRIKLLTTGTLKFTQLNGAENGIDVFCVGGGGGGGEGKSGSGEEGWFASGGGGGGGGYCNSDEGISVTVGTSYAITVGAGGSPGNDGGKTSAFGVDASGGNSGKKATAVTVPGTGGEGGSNGGTGGYYGTASAVVPGSDGSPGQGSTTTAFASGGGKKYSGGGGGGQGFNSYGAILSGLVAGGADTGAASNANAMPNGGGGGGGGGATANCVLTEAGSGGSGIVIIRNKR